MAQNAFNISSNIILWTMLGRNVLETKRLIRGRKVSSWCETTRIPNSPAVVTLVWYPSPSTIVIERSGIDDGNQTMVTSGLSDLTIGTEGMPLLGSLLGFIDTTFARIALADTISVSCVVFFQNTPTSSYSSFSS